MEGFGKNPYEKPRYPVIKVDPDQRPAVSKLEALREIVPLPEERGREMSEAEHHSRRDLLIGGSLSAVATLGAANVALEYMRGEKESGGSAHAATTEQPHHEQRRSRIEHDLRRDVDLGPLAGTRLSGMGAKYFQWHEKEPILNKEGKVIGQQVKPLPAQLHGVRFDESVHQIWKEKLTAHPNKHLEAMARWHVASYRELLRTGQEGRTTVEGFIQGANETITPLRAALDWQRAGELYSLSVPQLQVLAALAARIDGSVLAAYAMTETMSSGVNAKADLLLFDGVLRSAGVEFVNRIAAIYDGQPSWGAYQFTPLALNEIVTPATKDTPEHTEYVGASKMNRAVTATELKAPANVYGLKNIKDHNTAAYLFALHNLADTIGKIPDTQVATLTQLPHEVLIEFISASHHEPAPTRTGLLKYVHAGDTRNSLMPHIHGTGVEKYAERTATNYQSVGQIAQIRSASAHQYG